MMASLYATPPPDTSDLNGEDTSVLSDTSNSSQTNSSINSQQPHKAPKRSILVSSPSIVSSNNYPLLGNIFDSSPDLSKKRRKQTTPIRISATAFELQQQQHQNNYSVNANDLATNRTSTEQEITEIQDFDDEEEEEVSAEHEEKKLAVPSTLASVSLIENDGLQKIFLKNLSQLQASTDHNNESNLNENSRILSQENSLNNKSLRRSLSSPPPTTSTLDLSSHNGKNDESIVSKQRDFENDIEAEYHNKFMKSTNEKSQQGEVGKGSNNCWSNKQDKKPDDSWLSLASLPFPFPPEAAAAALSVSGYLPQLPLLSSVGTFGAADGVLSRSTAPLRIFNPEAYCDLCNKEFCNKYFLKTHKANKHGIYEPMTPMSNSDMPTLSQLSQMQQMSHVLQMQQQSMQQFNQQNVEQAQKVQAATVAAAAARVQVQSDPLPPQAPLVTNAFCDVCFKKFSSPAALKKHRLKIHEIGISKPQNDMSNKSGEEQQQQQETSGKNGHENERNEEMTTPVPFNLPEGFREDYQVEQEDTNFTPEPRKLSPSSMQQAKDANFSYDKLKRLGVINPEAFCELCCKEYCNKYFLRTHKLKRHGVFVPSEDTKDDGHSLWPYMQTSPLNLIMGGDLKALQMYAKKKEELESGIIKIPSPKPSDYDEIKNDTQTSKDEDEDDKGKKSPQLSQQESEAISVDLQKLQSMILQLNELNQNRYVACAICGKEMENQYMLHAHMLTEHSGFTNNNSIKLSPRPTSIPSPGEYESCKQCDKEFSNIFLLKQHLIEQHGMGSLSPPLREGFVTPDRKVSSVLSQPSTPTQNDRKQMFQMTPTSSYCEICNKELCNKYFMKTHMQRMHGIEIENGAQIGGVVCNICNKELCSKYFLRVHKHNTHGIVEDGSPQQRPGSESVDSDTGFQMDLKPGEVSDQSNRYFSHFTEVCPLCSRRFRSAKWLKAHLMSDHGKAGVEKLNEIETKIGPIKAPSPGLKIPNGGYGLASPELMIKTSLGGLFPGESSMAISPGSHNTLKGYQCSFCSFSTPILAILFIHERSHQAGNSTLNLMPNPNKSESAVSIAKEFSNSQQPTPGISSPSSTPASTPIPSNPQESKSEINNIINILPQLNSRPSVALPQESGPLVMQSFLLEESSLSSKSLVNGKTGTNDNYRFVSSMVILPVRERISSPITVSFTLTPT
ncbi:CLUMA_CG012758, isoform A [Clunio marinus]|uniref:CLUMA_CG012758, isoform A n=1 Tax=Clunio marinus TaxID=568069 RepID=A0A1J1IHX2_9DIPT|nr:CLUMA_CG012758, isoform A [Clunio marinus]